METEDFEHVCQAILSLSAETRFIILFKLVVYSSAQLPIFVSSLYFFFTLFLRFPFIICFTTTITMMTMMMTMMMRTMMMTTTTRMTTTMASVSCFSVLVYVPAIWNRGPYGTAAPLMGEKRISWDKEKKKRK